MGNGSGNIPPAFPTKNGVVSECSRACGFFHVHVRPTFAHFGIRAVALTESIDSIRASLDAGGGGVEFILENGEAAQCQ